MNSQDNDNNLQELMNIFQVESEEILERIFENLITLEIKPQDKELTANLYRDGFHMSLGLGRYATALLWYATLSGKGIDGVTFSAFDEPVSLEDIKTVKTVINSLIKG